MKQDEILEIAKEVYGETAWTEASLARLQQFVNLIAQKVKDRIMFGSRDDWVLAEREACAKLCDSTIHDTYIEGYTGARHSGRRECAAAIRARGEQA